MVTTAQQLRDSLDAIAAIEPGFAAALARAGYPEPRVRAVAAKAGLCAEPGRDGGFGRAGLARPARR